MFKPIITPHRSFGSIRYTLRAIHTFTRPDLISIRKSLLPLPTSSLDALPPHTNFPSARVPAESAILVPLMNLNGEAHVLLQIRAASMRVHAGEAR